MGSINETVAKRVAKLFRMLGSDFDGEVLAAVHRMKHQLGAEGLSINDIATAIENANGEIEELKYSDAEVEVIYQKGVEQGRVEEARKQVYESLSADDKRAHGLSPSFWAFDEYAQAPNSDLLETLRTSMGKRSESLGIVISTQAANDFHPLSQLIDDAAPTTSVLTAASLQANQTRS